MTKGIWGKSVIRMQVESSGTYTSSVEVITMRVGENIIRKERWVRISYTHNKVQLLRVSTSSSRQPLVYSYLHSLWDYRDSHNTNAQVQSPTTRSSQKSPLSYCNRGPVVPARNVCRDSSNWLSEAMGDRHSMWKFKSTFYLLNSDCTQHNGKHKWKCNIVIQRDLQLEVG